MKFVVFGLAISSSWGNGHATLWRGLCRALARRGHRVTFFERDVPYYAAHRDLRTIDPHTLVLYGDWADIRPTARRELADADVGIVTSFCADGADACALVLAADPPATVFYDLDTPITLAKLRAGEAVGYLPAQGLSGFDLVLSYTGGLALSELQVRLGARHVAPLYGSVDPDVHRPGRPREAFQCDLSYLGTYAADRQAALERLFVDASRRSPGRKFLLGGSQYPDGFTWTPNLFYVHHVPPGDHADFYASSRATLNVTRGAMVAMGYCPSGRLFEAAACGAAIMSDAWDGLGAFFVPGEEILPVSTTEDVLAALDMPAAELRRIGQAAQARVLGAHTADARVRQLEALIADVANPWSVDLRVDAQPGQRGP